MMQEPELVTLLGTEESEHVLPAAFGQPLPVTVTVPPAFTVEGVRTTEPAVA